MFSSTASCVDYVCSDYPRLPNMMDKTTGSVCDSVAPWKRVLGAKKNTTCTPRRDGSSGGVEVSQWVGGFVGLVRWFVGSLVGWVIGKGIVITQFFGAGNFKSVNTVSGSQTCSPSLPPPPPPASEIP